MRYARLFILVLAILALWACKKDPVTPDPVDNAPKDITLDAASFDVPQQGQSLTLTVTAPSRPKVTGLPDWIALTDGTYKDYKITFGLKVAENTDYEERSVTLTVTSGDLSKTVAVKQAAAERPTPPEPATVDADLTNAHASAAARKVYEFLRMQFGQRILSGVQSGGTANNNDRVNEIYQKTG